ncbi:MAG: MBL fold metallo-hydrolase, partial [Apilactobacillus sp.]|nr:MBL fold metallo-hydrolase [Apilactobacillus sp.]
LEITFKKTQHPVVTFAIKIKDKATNQVLVYTGDTRYFEGLTTFCEGADLLMTDTNFYEDKEGQKWHMTSEETGKLALDANVNNVLISHLPQYGDLDDLKKQTEMATNNSVNVILPKTGMVIDLKDVKSLN